MFSSRSGQFTFRRYSETVAGRILRALHADQASRQSSLYPIGLPCFPPSTIRESVSHQRKSCKKTRGALGRNRTCDQKIRSLLLYPLSYEGLLQV